MLRSKITQLGLSLLLFPFGLFFSYRQKEKSDGPKWAFKSRVAAIAISAVSFNILFVKPVNAHVVASVMWANVLTTLALAAGMMHRKLPDGRWNFYYAALVMFAALISCWSIIFGWYVSRTRTWYYIFVISVLVYLITLIIGGSKLAGKER